MVNDELQLVSGSDPVQVISFELLKDQSSRGRRIRQKFLFASLSSIPWVGGFIAAAAAIPSEEAALRKDELRTKWLEEHRRKIEQLEETLVTIVVRFEEFGDEIEERIQSPEYLSLVRQAFRAWDSAETDDKRRFVANLLTNSACTRVCSDDVVRLFIAWLDQFHEAHFAVIREVSENPGTTRFDMWTEIYGELPREDSAEADLYKMLIRDLSLGGVIRQARGTNEAGQFVRKRPPRRRQSTPTTLESAFEDTKPYVLTTLGRQFVHYTLMGDIRRLEQA